MNLRFVEAFYWTVSLKSVTRCAEKLFITQSAVSARIAALEEELGIALVDRGQAGFAITTAGTRFFQYAGRMLELQQEARQQLGAKQMLPERLRVGVIESVLHSWLVPWLDEIRRQFPEVAMELTVETTPVLTDQIRRGLQDLVIAALPASSEGIEQIALDAMPMVWVTPPGMFRKKTIALEEIAKHEMLTFQRGSQPHTALLERLKIRRSVAQTKGAKIHNISSLSAMIRLVKSDFGLATLPRAALEEPVRAKEVSVIQSEPSLAPLPIYLSFRSDPSAPLIQQATILVKQFSGGSLVKLGRKSSQKFSMD